MLCCLGTLGVVQFAEFKTYLSVTFSVTWSVVGVAMTERAGPVRRGTNSVFVSCLAWCGQGTFGVRWSVESGTCSFHLICGGDVSTLVSMKEWGTRCYPQPHAPSHEGGKPGVMCGIQCLCVQIKIQFLCEKGGWLCVGEARMGRGGGDYLCFAITPAFRGIGVHGKHGLPLLPHPRHIA